MRNQIPYSGYGNVYDCGPRGCFDGCAPTYLVTPPQQSYQSNDLERQIHLLWAKIIELQNKLQIPITPTNTQSIYLNASGLYNTSLYASVRISSQPGNALTLLSDGLYVTPSSGPTLPVITGPSDQSVNVGQNATFTITVNSASSYTTQWYVNSTLITGATNLSYIKTNCQLSDSGEIYTANVTNSGGVVVSDPATLTVTEAPPTITGYLYYNANDPGPTLQGQTDPFTYQQSYNITHNADISVTLPSASSPNMYLVFKIPSTESAKTTWFNTQLNSGAFPDSAFQTPITFNGYTYYYSRQQLSMDTTQPFILS